MATERPGAVSLNGNDLTLIGDELKVGASAPGYDLVSRDMQPVSPGSAAGKTRIVLSAPSLDTPVCAVEAKKFAERAGELDDTEVLFVTMDLPFAQSRFCTAEGVDNLTFASDHRSASFGEAFGVLIKENRLLSRAAFVINPAGEVTYAEYCPELPNEPNYDAVIEAAKAAGQPA